MPGLSFYGWASVRAQAGNGLTPGGRARADRRRRQPVAPDLAQGGVRAGQIGAGDAQVGVVRERLADQAVKDRVGE